MHFTFDVSLGQVITALTFLGIAWRFNHKLDIFLLEHEILIRKYCKDIGIEIEDLPTRFSRSTRRR